MSHIIPWLVLFYYLLYTYNSMPSSVEKLGFTLIEILLTVAIIAVLATIVAALINVPGQTAKAKIAADKDRLADIGKAIELFRIDKGYYPADEQRGIMPAGLDPYITGNDTVNFPAAKVGGCAYDYENWQDGRTCSLITPPYPVQITLRCYLGDSPDAKRIAPPGYTAGGYHIWYVLDGNGYYACNPGDLGPGESGECMNCN